MGAVNLHQIETPAGPIRYRDDGEGEPLVFVHGVLADAGLWRKLIPLLSDRYRCLAPDWPLGSHPQPMRAEADLSPDGLVEVIIGFLDALELETVTLVGNDTGGALSQLVAARHPERISRLVLTPCDAYENFPPRSIFWPLALAARIPGGFAVLLWLLRFRLLQQLPFSFAGLTKRLDPSLIRTWIEPARRQPGVRRDLAKVVRGIHRRYTLEAAEQLRTFEKPVLIAWAPQARFFPLRYGERLAADLPNARLALIDDAYTFVSEDQPQRTADVITSFMAGNSAGDRQEGP